MLGYFFQCIDVFVIYTAVLTAIKSLNKHYLCSFSVVEAVYNRWRAENNTLLKAATEENQSSFTQMQQSLVTTVSAVRGSTDSIYTGAGEIAAGSNDLSARTEQQAASLEETAASMEELTATVKQNSDNARQATLLAKNASETAARGGHVVDNVVRPLGRGGLSGGHCPPLHFHLKSHHQR